MAAGSGGPSNDRVETLLGRLMGNTPKKLERVFDVIGFSRKTPKRKSAKSFSKHLNLKASFKFLQGIFKTSSRLLQILQQQNNREISWILLLLRMLADGGWGPPGAPLGLVVAGAGSRGFTAGLGLEGGPSCLSYILCRHDPT